MSVVVAALSRVVVTIAETNVNRKVTFKVILLHRIHRRLLIYVLKIGLPGFFFFCLFVCFVLFFCKTDSHSVAQADLSM